MSEEFKQYIGFKVMKARPMPCPKDQHKSKVGDPGYEVEYEDGYRSWCPKEIFEKFNRETAGLTANDVLLAVRSILPEAEASRQ